MLRHFLIQRIAMLESILTGVAGRTLPYIGAQTALKFCGAGIRQAHPVQQITRSRTSETMFRSRK
jgi:hypothetical protein